MATLLDLAKLTQAVYATKPGAIEGWTIAGTPRVARDGGIWDGLQACHYVRSNSSDEAVAFRGTNIALATIVGTVQDLIADAKLGFGSNSAYFSAAEDFMKPYLGKPEVVVCGHSLGGAVAQIIANRLGFRLASFNAPGVSVVASRNILDADPIAAAVRVNGMFWSAPLHPMQAWSDIRSAFNTVKGVNVFTDKDPVSKIGIHYGLKKQINSVIDGGPMAQHSIDSVIKALEKDDKVGGADIKSF